MSSTAIRNSGLIRPTDRFVNAPNYVNTTTMGSTGIILTIPAGAQYVRLAANLDFYVLWGSSGVDTAAHSTGLGSEFVPYGTVLERQMTTLGTSAVSVASTAPAFLSHSWWTV